MAETGALERGRENATQIVSTFVTGTWILALIAGFDWWLWFMLFGYMVLLPTVSTLFGGEDEWEEGDEEWHEGDDQWGERNEEWGTGREPDAGPDAKVGAEADNRDALGTLRARYARGELTDDQFERKVERLLETETLDDVEDRARGPESGAETAGEPDEESFTGPSRDESRRETDR